VSNQKTQIDTAFPVAGAIALDLIQRAEVRDQWQRPSALPKMSTGALACHLGRQLARAADLLPVPADVPPLGSVDDHYQRAAWVTTTSPDDPPNDRSKDDAEAALGPAALADRVASSLAEVNRLLDSGTAADAVMLAWQGWSLRREDFLLTRMLEIVVHSDDLAISVGTATPDFPDAVFAPVRDLLVRLAVRRRGQSAVISALTRRERAGVISAF
jgi:hypothetical protein